MIIKHTKTVYTHQIKETVTTKTYGMSQEHVRMEEHVTPVGPQ